MKNFFFPLRYLTIDQMSVEWKYEDISLWLISRLVVHRNCERVYVSREKIRKLSVMSQDYDVILKLPNPTTERKEFSICRLLFFMS